MRSKDLLSKEIADSPMVRESLVIGLNRAVYQYCRLAKARNAVGDAAGFKEFRDRAVSAVAMAALIDGDSFMEAEVSEYYPVAKIIVGIELEGPDGLEIVRSRVWGAHAHKPEVRDSQYSSAVRTLISCVNDEK